MLSNLILKVMFAAVVIFPLICLFYKASPFVANIFCYLLGFCATVFTLTYSNGTRK